MAGKGSKPRNNYSKQFRDNYDEIDWTEQKWTIKLDENTIGILEALPIEKIRGRDVETENKCK